jgi:aminopeptidase N
VLDTRDLEIIKVRSGRPEGELHDCDHSLGKKDDLLGSALTIRLPAGDDRVEVAYRTTPGATALQWVAPEGTSGGKKPFLYTQSQSIHARSWIPCHDSPGQRTTYEAEVVVPEGFQVVMSADGPEKAEPGSGEGGWNRYRFRMTQAIPAYLIALAVGDLAYRELGPRSRVWAEPGVVEAAAWEFADVEKMMAAAEKRFGPYRWGRYDILVLPPSFPFGGMENARLTFATPTVLAGDRSLVSLIAHELAHSWSGNLVTCASWEHLWLNEGLTTYLERRIVEDVYGPDVAAMERSLGYQGLLEEMKDLDPRDEVLAPDLDNRDPDTALSGVPYEKGALFLTQLETASGRERFDAFLRGYFDDHAFQSLDSADFVSYLRDKLIAEVPKVADRIDLKAWLSSPGLPGGTQAPTCASLEEVDGLAAQWLAGQLKTADVPWTRWSTMERVRFLQALPERPDAAMLADFDARFEVTAKANNEVVVLWLERAIRAGYAQALPRVEEFLTSIGRNRYILPLYRALMETPAGKERARAIFEKARAGYHPLSVDAARKVVEAA